MPLQRYSHASGGGRIGKKSRCLERSPEDDDSFTFNLFCFDVHEPNSAENVRGAAEIRVATQTGKHMVLVLLELADF